MARPALNALLGKRPSKKKKAAAGPKLPTPPTAAGNSLPTGPPQPLPALGSATHFPATAPRLMPGRGGQAF